MEGYQVKIVKTGIELSAKERIQLKDTSNCISLDEAVADGSLQIMPVNFAVLDIHNEQSDNKDYSVMVLICDNGYKYKTGSESFITTFLGIWEDAKELEEEWSIEVYKKDSRNFVGRQFLTCSIV